MASKGLPGLSRVDHVALTVPDLDAAVRFYCDVIGGVELYRLGPFDAREIPKMPDGRDWTDAHVRVADARVRIAMVQLAKGLLLELFRYERPENARKEAVRNCDYGGHHVAFKVENLDAAKAYLKERGIEVMEGPIVLGEGPAAGFRANYFLDPWQNQLELVEYETLPFMNTVKGFVHPR